MVLTLSRQFVTLTGTGKAVRVFSSTLFLCLISCFVCLFYILYIILVCFGIVLCVVPFLYIAVCVLRLYKFSDYCHLVETQLQLIVSYHITSQSSPMLGIYFTYFLRTSSSDRLLHPIGFKLQQIPHTESHSIHIEWKAYNSGRVYPLITSVSLATAIDTPRITLCQREVTYSMLQNWGDSKKDLNQRS